MNKQELVPYALDLLQAIDQEPSVSVADLCKGRVASDTVSVIERLTSAGILESRDNARVALLRPLCDFTSLEILQAIWGETVQTPAFRWLYQPSTTAAAFEHRLWATSTHGMTNDEGK